MAVEVEPVSMGCAMAPDDVHRFGDSGAFAATTTLLAERDAQPGTAVASLDEPSRQGVTLRVLAMRADR